jgi:integrase
MVDGRWRRTGKREYFKKRIDAETRADQLAIERKNSGGESLNFSTELRVMATSGHKRLLPFGKTLAHAVDHYVDWLESERKKRESLLVEECVERYVKARRADHDRKELSKLSLYEITARANQLASAFRGSHIRELTALKMKDYLDAYPAGQRTRTNIRLRLSRFFNWARDQGFIDSNPVERIRFKVPESEITVLSVAESESLLRAAEDSGESDLVAFVALGLFGGMRPGEASQLRWEHVDFKTKTIEVRPATSKVRRRRIFEMHPTLVAWLKPLREDSGPIVQPNFRKRSGEVLTGIGTNVLRHTGASMALAHFQNRNKLAEDLGTSVDVIAKFYRRPVPKKEASRFFKLRPRP